MPLLAVAVEGVIEVTVRACGVPAHNDFRAGGAERTAGRLKDDVRHAGRLFHHKQHVGRVETRERLRIFAAARSGHCEAVGCALERDLVSLELQQLLERGRHVTRPAVDLRPQYVR